jgi:hypothetical protein
MFWWKDVLMHGVDVQQRCTSDIGKYLNKAGME